MNRRSFFGMLAGGAVVFPIAPLLRQAQRLNRSAAPIADAHGKIAMELTTLLVARGDTVVGLIRNPVEMRETAYRGDIQGLRTSQATHTSTTSYAHWCEPSAGLPCRSTVTTTRRHT